MTNTAVHPLQGLAGGAYYPVSGDAIACRNSGRLESAAIAAIRNSRELLTEGRGWIIDAYDLDPELYDPPIMQIVKVIHSNYAGGCTSFYLNSLQLTPKTTRKA